MVKAAGIISWGVGAKVSARVYTLKVEGSNPSLLIIPEDHRFKPCMAHTTRTAEICALNISSKSWQAYFKVFSLHELINMIVRDQHCYRRIDRKARAPGFKQWRRT